jgi:hypothetical protein
MPTPESAAFLAKKPTVPPTFDGVDYDDTKRLKQAQDAIVREQWVNVMMGRLVREELGKCYYREGVNHLEKCGHLRGQSHPTQEELLCQLQHCNIASSQLSCYFSAHAIIQVFDLRRCTNFSSQNAIFKSSRNIG